MNGGPHRRGAANRAVAGRRARRVAAAIALAALLGGPPILVSAAGRDALLVYCGAGFRLPVEEAARAYGARENRPVEVTYAGSGCLLAEAELARRGDLLIPGEIHYLRQAQERGLAGEAVPLAVLHPVIAVPKGNPHGVRDLADLARGELRIGLGDPQAVAVGLVAERWIAAELPPAAARALLANVRTRALNVNELGTQLSLGALDAAVVWDATVPLFPGLAAVRPAGSALHPTVVVGGVLSSTRQPAAARDFLSFLAGREGRAIFRRHGYQAYDGTPPLDQTAVTHAGGGQ